MKKYCSLCEYGLYSGTLLTKGKGATMHYYCRKHEKITKGECIK